MPVIPGPSGRYGHAACMNDTRFYVFGGQVEGEFMNDLWSYDIKQCPLLRPELVLIRADRRSIVR